MKKILMAFAISCLGLTAQAAEITTDKNGELTYIYVVGEIQQEDGDKFKQIADQIEYHKGVVLLEGPGGLARTGMYIGAIVHDKGFGTGVATTCLSACAMIWLAGQPRMRSADSMIGFHQVFDQEGNANGPGNGIAGAYLNELGLGLTAIEYVLQSSPDDITYLNAADAKRVGIDYKTIGKTEAKNQSTPKPKKVPDKINYPASIDLWCTPTDDPSDRIHTWATFRISDGMMTSWFVVHNLNGVAYNRWEQYNNFKSVRITGLYDYRWFGEQTMDARYHMDGRLIRTWHNGPDRWIYYETSKLNGVMKHAMTAICQ